MSFDLSLSREMYGVAHDWQADYADTYDADDCQVPVATIEGWAGRVRKIEIELAGQRKLFAEQAETEED